MIKFIRKLFKIKNKIIVRKYNPSVGCGYSLTINGVELPFKRSVEIEGNEVVVRFVITESNGYKVTLID